MIIGRPASLMTNEGPNWRESPSALSAHTRAHAHAREPQAKFHQYTHLRPAGIDAARPHSSRGSGLRRIRATGRPTSRLTISSWFRVLHTLPHVLTYGFDQCLRRRRRRRRLNGDSLIVLFGYHSTAKGQCHIRQCRLTARLPTAKFPTPSMSGICTSIHTFHAPSQSSTVKT